jgi:hypothetical protein
MRYLSFEWSDYEDYLDALGEFRDFSANKKALTYITLFNLEDFEEWCDEEEIEADSAYSRALYVESRSEQSELFEDDPFLHLQELQLHQNLLSTALEIAISENANEAEIFRTINSIIEDFLDRSDEIMEMIMHWGDGQWRMTGSIDVHSQFNERVREAIKSGPGYIQAEIKEFREKDSVLLEALSAEYAEMGIDFDKEFDKEFEKSMAAALVERPPFIVSLDYDIQDGNLVVTSNAHHHAIIFALTNTLVYGGGLVFRKTQEGQDEIHGIVCSTDEWRELSSGEVFASYAEDAETGDMIAPPNAVYKGLDDQ